MSIWQLFEKAPSDFFNRFPEYPRIVLQLLFNRGLKTEKLIDNFLNSDYESGLHDPYLMNDMKRALERIFLAIEGKEKIVIYGDYDTDGICASAILYFVLTELEAIFDVFIPDRFADGYGLNLKTLGEIIGEGAKLIITVDCGITDYTEIQFANSRGIDVIITDHHLVPEKTPPAYAIINTKQKDDDYPFKMLCGTGVAFKLVQGIIKFAQEKKLKKFPAGWEKWLLDLAAIATVSDLVPLLGENRTLVKYGLIVLAQTRRIGLKKLLKSAGIEKYKINVRNGKVLGVLGFGTEALGYLIGPRINAASRMDHATTSFELLTTKSGEEAQMLAKKLEEKNRERRNLIEKILAEAELKIDLKNKIIFIGSENWSSGVIGLVAGKLSDKYSRPIFVYNQGKEESKGSVRSIEGFNAVEEMKNCGDIFIEAGGHAMAAGFTIKNEFLEEFKKRILEIGEQKLKNEDLAPKIKIDAEIQPEEFSWDLYDWLIRFEPCGKDNLTPVFLMKGLKIDQTRLVGDDKHLKIEFYDEKLKKRIKGIGFGLAFYNNQFKVGNLVDVVFTASLNEWNGKRELEMKIVDMALSK